MPKIEPPFFPIIYVRGYAGNDEEVEDTVSDPYMGFNLGATKLRQLWTGEIQRHYFESPLVRLMKDHGYRDVYSAGLAMAPDEPIDPKSVIIYRYYDQVSASFGSGGRKEIEDYAKGLSDLILTVRERVCVDAAGKRAFRVYLVGHSMGGLVIRCFLQNTRCGSAEARRLVDKVFTYATPHNGIEFSIIGNVPDFFSRNNADNFNRNRMSAYLALPKRSDAVDSLDGAFDPARFFCLIGTDAKDYLVARGWSARVVGPMSDGLVRITNAAVWGPGADGERVHAPRAFVHRSHSGYYGIVNSEEGYQNLTRFLFGHVRVDGVLEVATISLPDKLEKKRADGSKVRASYHIEAVTRTRGAQWDLSRRVVSENSAVFRTYDELVGNDTAQRSPHLFSTFLNDRARVVETRPSLGFSIDLGIMVPEYEVDGGLWLDDHYPGGYLFRDKINLEVVPPADGKDNWRLRYGFDSKSPNRAVREAVAKRGGGGLQFRIPIVQTTKPGIEAQLVLTGTPWNVDRPARRRRRPGS